MGLDIYQTWKGKTDADQKAQYTGFANAGDAGYLRSAYNDHGLNRWLEVNTGHTLEWIFDITKEKLDAYYKESEKDDGRFDKGLEANWFVASDRLRQMKKKIGLKSRIVRTQFVTEMEKPVEWSEMKEGMGAQGYSHYGKEPIKVIATRVVTRPILGNGIQMLCELSNEMHNDFIGQVAEIEKFIKSGTKRNARIAWSG